MPRWILSILLIPAVLQPAQATIVAYCEGPEKSHILNAIQVAKQTLDLRVQTLGDAEIVRALNEASKRHVMVRIVVDEMSSPLIMALRTRKVEFEVRVLAPKHHGLFLGPSSCSWAVQMFGSANTLPRRAKAYLHGNAPEATLQVDSTMTWYGVARWDASHWVGISTLIIDSSNPAPPEGEPRFVRAWNAALSPPY